MRPNWTGVFLWLFVLALTGVMVGYVANTYHLRLRDPHEFDSIQHPPVVALPPAPVPKVTATPTLTPIQHPKPKVRTITRPKVSPVGKPLNIRSLCQQYVAYRQTPEWRTYCHGYR